MDQVELVLASIDRRSACGKRDYAMLLLLAVYGLRACEVATITLDDIDWRNERLRIRERKAGNTTTYRCRRWSARRLSTILGTGGRPRRIARYSLRALALSSRSAMRPSLPAPPISSAPPASASHAPARMCCGTVVCSDCSMPTFRSSTSRLRRSPQCFLDQIYGKIAIEQLRELAQGDGEEVL